MALRHMSTASISRTTPCATMLDIPGTRTAEGYRIADTQGCLQQMAPAARQATAAWRPDRNSTGSPALVNIDAMHLRVCSSHHRCSKHGMTNPPHDALPVPVRERQPLRTQQNAAWLTGCCSPLLTGRRRSVPPAHSRHGPLADPDIAATTCTLCWTSRSVLANPNVIT